MATTPARVSRTAPAVPITRIAYAAVDGSPRVVPLGYLLRDGEFLFFTILP